MQSAGSGCRLPLFLLLLVFILGDETCNCTKVKLISDDAFRSCSENGWEAPIGVLVDVQVKEAGEPSLLLQRVSDEASRSICAGGEVEVLAFVDKDGDLVEARGDGDLAGLLVTKQGGVGGGDTGEDLKWPTVFASCR